MNFVKVPAWKIEVQEIGRFPNKMVHEESLMQAQQADDFELELDEEFMRQDFLRNILEECKTE